MTAMHFEAKKHAYRQAQDGIVVSFVVHPNDMAADLAIAPLGTHYVVALAPYNETPSPSSNGRMPDSDSGDRGSSPRGETNPSSSNGRTADFESADRGSSPRDGSKSPAHEPEKAKERKPFHTLPRSQQAAIRCQDERFLAWLWPYTGTHKAGRAGWAPDRIREMCGVASRTAFDADEAAGKRWDEIEARYRRETGLEPEER